MALCEEQQRRKTAQVQPPSISAQIRPPAAASAQQSLTSNEIYVQLIVQAFSGPAEQSFMHQQQHTEMSCVEDAEHWEHHIPLTWTSVSQSAASAFCPLQAVLLRRVSVTLL